MSDVTLIPDAPPKPSRPGILETTLVGLERALRVEHIATFEDLLTCEADDRIPEVLARPDLEDFDFLPVKKDGRVVGVLERARATAGRAGDQAQGLDESTLMAATEPVADFIHGLRAKPYRLVVRRREVAGIVTRSDIQKLPVRLLVFTLVTHLEAQMASTIERLHPNDDWLGLLNGKRRKRVEEKRAELGEARLNIATVEFADFADKRDILLASQLPAAVDRGKKRVCKEFDRIEDLRNQVAHAATLPEGPDDLVERFVDVFESAEQWIAWFETAGASWAPSRDST